MDDSMTTTTIGLRIEPLDVLFFRDARPFGEGDAGRTQLPLPQTLAGMLRWHLATAAGLRKEQLHGGHPAGRPREEWPWFARVRIRGPWLYTSGPLVPAPADLVRAGRAADAPLRRLRPLAADVELPGWNPEHAGLRPLWHTGEEDVRPAAGFLDAQGLRRYLAGGTPAPEQLHDAGELYGYEPRTGVAIDAATGTTVEGRIYSPTFLRLNEGVHFHAELELPDDMPLALHDLFPESGVALAWGGEARRALVRPVERFDWSALCPPDAGERPLSLLITPGIFTHRWRPAERGTLVSAAVPKPLPVSGWNLTGVDGSGEHPRPTRWAVPAGAVYHWRRGRHNPNPPRTPGLEVLADRPQDADAGWGVALTGAWEPSTLDHGAK